MKTLLVAAVAAAAVFSLSACETYENHGPGPYASVDYVDGYYDNYYGAFDAGYWGDDGVFWYRGGDRQFHRDDAGHFRHDGNQGYHSFHSPGGHPDHHG